MKRNWGELHSRVILLLISHATKVKSAVLNSTPWSTIAQEESLHRPSPDAQTRSSDGGSGLTLSAHRQTLDKKKVGKTFQVGGAGAERCRCVEMLLQSSFIGREASGFHDTSFQHTMKCDVGIRMDLHAMSCRQVARPCGKGLVSA